MSHPYHQVHHHSKGAREETPLLGPASTSSSSYPHAHPQTHLAPPGAFSSPPAYSSISPPPAPAPAPIAVQHHHHYHFRDRPRSRSCCCCSLFSTLFILLFWFLVLAIPLGWTYYSKLSVLDGDIERIIKQHVVYRGPDHVQLLNVTHWGAWVNVEGRIGVDAAKMIGVEPENTYWGRNEPQWKTAWKGIGRWGIRNMKTVNVKLEGIEVWGAYSGDDGETKHEGRFFKAVAPPMDVPISADAPLEPRRDDAWLTPFSTPMFIQPSAGAQMSDLLSYDDGGRFVEIVVTVQAATIRPWGLWPRTGGIINEAWSDVADFVGGLVAKNLKHVQVGTELQLPSIPGFPRHLQK